MSPRAVFLVGLITAAAGVAIIVRGNILPPVYSGHVPTPFAHALYGALCVVQALALGMLLERRRAFTPRTLRLLTASLALTLASDVSLTLDANPNGWAFLLSHYLSILALYPLYMAFVEIGLDRPLRQLRESEHRYRALFESAPVGLCITTWGGKMVALNQRLREALALGDAPCERITLKDLMQSDERRLLLAELQERGRVAGWQATLRRSDGAWIPADVSVEPVRLDGQEVLLVTIADQSLQRRLEAEVLSIGEAQSRRIGRDLHDSLGQALTSTAFLAGVLTRKLSARELPEASDAKRIEALLAESVDTTRSLAQGLSPVGLRGDGFLAGLKDLADRTQETFGIACHARLDDACAVQDAVLASHLYRIAQEALTNAVKHAGPKNVWIELAREGGALRLSVRDDGQGLGPREAAGDGMGLRIMRYRANSVGGSLEVRRPSEGGTEVCCLLPAQALTRSNHE